METDDNSLSLLLVSADAGGTQEIQALNTYLSRNYKKYKCTVVTKPGNEDAASLFNSHFDGVICGTSIESDFEHRLWIEAKKRKIKSFALIDHWTNYYERFVRDNLVVLPDFILLNDDQAKIGALKAFREKKALGDFDESHFIVFGNPHFCEIKSYKPVVSRGGILAKLGISEKKKMILYLSDALTQACHGEKAAIDRFGFSEISILEDCLKEFENLASKHKINAAGFTLVIKLHPVDKDKKKYEDLLDKYSKMTMDWRVILHGELQNLAFSPWDLFYHSDFQIGSFTAALIEVALMGKNPLRVEINAKENALPSLTIKRITKREELESRLEEYLNQPQTTKDLNSNFCMDFEKILSELISK